MTPKIGIYNVSGRCKTAHSDIDVQVWLPSWAARLMPKRIAFGESFEVFFNDVSRPDQMALVAYNNSLVQKHWDEVTFAAYAAKKAQIAHLQGKERKAAKATLAVQFGLNPAVYQQCFA